MRLCKLPDYVHVMMHVIAFLNQWHCIGVVKGGQAASHFLHDVLVSSVIRRAGAVEVELLYHNVHVWGRAESGSIPMGC